MSKAENKKKNKKSFKIKKKNTKKFIIKIFRRLL